MNIDAINPYSWAPVNYSDPNPSPAISTAEAPAPSAPAADTDSPAIPGYGGLPGFGA